VCSHDVSKQKAITPTKLLPLCLAAIKAALGAGAWCTPSHPERLHSCSLRRAWTTSSDASLPILNGRRPQRPRQSARCRSTEVPCAPGGRVTGRLPLPAQGEGEAGRQWWPDP